MANGFRLTSSAFGSGQQIPARHACDGEDVSPALSWTDPPEGTRSLALTVVDPDAPSGEFVHWLAWGLAPGLRELPEAGEPPVEGRNGRGQVAYMGPCPPPGAPHHYVFQLHAMAEPVALAPGAGIRELRDVIAVHGLAVAELVGLYGRPARGR